MSTVWINRFPLDRISMYSAVISSCQVVTCAHKSITISPQPARVRTQKLDDERRSVQVMKSEWGSADVFAVLFWSPQRSNRKYTSHDSHDAAKALCCWLAVCRSSSALPVCSMLWRGSRGTIVVVGFNERTRWRARALSFRHAFVSSSAPKR